MMMNASGWKNINICFKIYLFHCEYFEVIQFWGYHVRVHARDCDDHDYDRDGDHDHDGDGSYHVCDPRNNWILLFKTQKYLYK